MTKFTTFANDVLDMEYSNLGATYPTAAAGHVRLGNTDYTFPVMVELTTTVSSASAHGDNVVGGSYAAQSLVGAMATDAASGSKSSSGALTFSGMPSCTWADVYTRDSNGTPKPMTFRGGSSLGKNVNAGDTALIPAGSFTGQET